MHTHSHSLPQTSLVIDDRGLNICKPNVEMGDRANSASNTSPPPLSFLLSVPPPPLTVCAPALSLGICHIDMKGPGQHCDMLRRQYKYLISPNGNRHGALIAPHIIWGAVSAADIPFDPSSMPPPPAPPPPSVASHLGLLLFMQFILGHVSLSAPPPLCLPAFTPLCRCCHRPRDDVSVSSPLAGHVCLLCCVLSSGALFAVVSHYDLGWGNIAARGHIRAQTDAHMGPRDNAQHWKPQAHLFCMYCMC